MSETPTPAAQSLPELARFMAFSQVLCEVNNEWLDPDVGQQIMASLAPDALRGLLQRSVGCKTLKDLEGKVFTNDADRELTDQILLAWYTGVVITDKGRQVATFMGALAWQCLGYTGAPTSCHMPWWTIPEGTS